MGYIGIESLQATFAICYDALRREYRVVEDYIDIPYTDQKACSAAEQTRRVYEDFCNLILSEIPANKDFVLTHKEVIETITLLLLKNKNKK